MDRSTEEGSLIVEFVGLPAVGKTHLAHEVKHRLSNEFPELADTDRLTSSSRTRARLGLPGIGVRMGRVLASSPLSAARSLRDLRQTDQETLQRVLRYWLYQEYVRAELRIARARGELHLSDQGFIQHLWRVHLTGDESSQASIRQTLAQYDPHVIPDVVIFVEVDHHTRMKRGVERGTPVAAELFDPDHPEIQRDRVAYQDIRTVVESIAHGTRMRDPIVVTNTEADLRDNVEMLVGQICRLWRGK